MDLLVVANDRPRDEIDVYVAECAHALRAVGRARASSQHRPHARQELAGSEGLRQVIIGAGVERLDLIVLVGPRGQHEDRHVAPSAHVADEIDAATVGQAEIDDQKVGLARAGLDGAAASCLGLGHAVPLGFERDTHEAADLGIVLDDHDLRRRVHGISWAC